MVSKEFKKVISDYIKNESNKDPLFKPKAENPKKNIDDCCTYILNQVKKSGQNGFADAEIFGMAIHYYQEDKIEVGNKINARVVVNHHVDKSSKAPAKKSNDLFSKPVKNSQKELKKSTPKKVEKKESKPVFKVDQQTNQVSLF